VRQQVVDFLLAHGATDTQHSGFIFHFQTYQTLIFARDAMRQAIPNAFHRSVADVEEINLLLAQNQRPLLPFPTPIAEAFIIMKTAVLATDYLVDIAFFLRA
jgi:hypothetical protein